MATVYKARPRIDGVNAAEVQAEIMDMIATSDGEMIVDLSETKYISSAGLRVLLAAHKKKRASGGEFYLRGVSPTVREILDVTGFSGFLNIEN